MPSSDLEGGLMLLAIGQQFRRDAFDSSTRRHVNTAGFRALNKDESGESHSMKQPHLFWGEI